MSAKFKPMTWETFKAKNTEEALVLEKVFSCTFAGIPGVLESACKKIAGLDNTFSPIEPEFDNLTITGIPTRYSEQKKGKNIKPDLTIGQIKALSLIVLEASKLIAQFEAALYPEEENVSAKNSGEPRKLTGFEVEPEEAEEAKTEEAEEAEEEKLEVVEN